MKTLITSALPYINGVKHLGNLVGSMLPADVYARFLRQEGQEVLFLCATDEHGVPAELAAQEAGLPVDRFCEEQHQIQADIYRRFGLSFDHFGRTSSPSQHELTQLIFKQLDAAGYIERRATEQVYSIDDARYLPDRYVIGTCPRCGYTAARGDQCENCTSLLDPTDLLDPRSAVSGSKRLEVRSTDHLYLLLSKLEPRIREWVEKQTEWPALTRQVAGKWLGEGLRDRGITRNLDWGVRVPKEGLEHLVFYVWFDAPIGYISATRDWAAAKGTPDAWQEYWLDAKDVRYVQVMGKDNLPFHSIMFPGMLLGTGAPWKLADQIKSFHWLNYYGGKFSTSSKRGVFTDAALTLYPADFWRYALLAHAPESSDSTFTWELFASTVNKDLAAILGNFVNRVFRFTQSKFGNTIPDGGTPGEAEAQLAAECAAEVEAFRSSLHALEFRRAMQALRKLWTLGNLYIDAQAPWTAFKQDRDRAAVVIRTCFNLVRLYGVISQPVIPFLARTLLDALGLSESERAGSAAEHLDLGRLAAGRPFEVIPPLVDRIEDAEIATLKERFGGEG